MFSVVFAVLARAADGVEDKGSGHTTKVDVETHLKALIEEFQISDCFPQLLKGQDFRICGVSGSRLKELYRVWLTESTFMTERINRVPLF